MNFFLIILFFLLSLLGLINKRSSFVQFLIFSLIIVLFGFNISNPDFENYELKYEVADSFMLLTGEPGFTLLCYLCSSIGLTFIQFRLVTGLLFYILFFSTVKKQTKYVAFFSAVYLLFFFIIDVTQIRNFYAFVIIYYAIQKFLHQNASNKEKFLYSLFVLIATTLHYSSVFFLLFLLSFKKVSWYKLGAFMGVALFVVSVMYIFLNDRLEKDMSRYSGAISMLAAVVISFVQVGNYFYIRHIRNLSLHVRSRNIYAYPFELLNCNKLLICLIPFYFDSMIFSRLFRYVAIINVIYIINVLILKKSAKEWAVLTLYLLFFAYMFFISGNKETGVMDCVFSFNSFPNIK